MNLAILMKSCHSHNGDEFGKISSNSQINANTLNTWKPAMLADLTILANVTNLNKQGKAPLTVLRNVNSPNHASRKKCRVP